jgi:hypothetical protein
MSKEKESNHIVNAVCLVVIGEKKNFSFNDACLMKHRLSTLFISLSSKEQDFFITKIELFSLVTFANFRSNHLLSLFHNQST